MKLGKYSFGMGDRFAHEGEAQLTAIIEAQQLGVEITPVWNKSYREHKTVNTSPEQVREEADQAVKKLNWNGPYLVDADHINLTNVDQFIETADFFTIDVADYIGKAASEQEIKEFISKNEKYLGELSIPGLEQPFSIDENDLKKVGAKFLYAAQEASRIYQHIEKVKGKDQFVAEVSMDEVDDPQTPAELFFILSALAFNQVPMHTIAPKFTGRFNKGVDYVGDVNQFAREFEQDLLVIDLAVKEFGLPTELKLSVHSGSDKFSIYPPINQILKKYSAGVHVKTAGTTWLEELIGLSLAGPEGLTLAQEIYARALDRFDELTGPYATVIDIKKDQLPSAEQVKEWDGQKYANSLRHNPNHPDYNPNFRQLLHCGYKIAAEYGETYYDALKKFRQIIAQNVTENLLERHIKPIFLQ